MLWAVLPLLLAVGCARSEGKEDQRAHRPQAVPVEVMQVEAKRVDYEVHATGSVEAFETVQITARVPGVVEKLAFQEGDEVVAGSLLAEIEPRRYELQYAAAKAALAGIEATRDEARRELERGERLVAEGVGMSADVDTWRTRVATSMANEAQARAQLGIAGLNLKDARIRAPIPGVIQSRRVETGQYVSVGTVLATLLQRDPLQLRFKVSESEAARLTLGAPVQFRVKDNETTFEAKLVFVAEAADSTTRMVSATAEITDPGAALRPGAFAEVTAKVGAAEAVIVVPEAAIRPSERGFLAHVVEGNAVRERTVNLGMRTPDGKVEVRSGLAVGESLVIRGNEGLSEGTAVQLSAPHSASPAATTTPTGTH
jgi:membrane fusion protein, multidrug efflux system